MTRKVFRYINNMTIQFTLNIFVPKKKYIYNLSKSTFQNNILRD